MSSIIYEPSRNFFFFQDALDKVALPLGLGLAADFVGGGLRPWAYYAGLGAGAATAAMTTIPGAAVGLYVVGEFIDMQLLKSPDGGTIDLFLDGVAVSTVSTLAVGTAWEAIRVVVESKGDTARRVDFRNVDSQFFAVSTVAVYPSPGQLVGRLVSKFFDALDEIINGPNPPPFWELYDPIIALLPEEGYVTLAELMQMGSDANIAEPSHIKDVVSVMAWEALVDSYQTRVFADDLHPDYPATIFIGRRRRLLPS